MKNDIKINNNLTYYYFFSNLYHFIVASSQAQFNCTFDSGFCGWTQPPNTALNWTSNNGSTFSFGTGPQADHTTGIGLYLFKMI